MTAPPCRVPTAKLLPTTPEDSASPLRSPPPTLPTTKLLPGLRLRPCRRRSYCPVSAPADDEVSDSKFSLPCERSLLAEERMRVHHERRSKKLKWLDEKGAEAHKIDVTRNLVRSLSSKIKIAIQVVDKISITINKLRDEELWPLINEFIQGK
ncbi:PREDICTED: uncharacterized protein LOC109151114 [Ipomoea nil]|uniref:uncharacterized protein LOC109151114 n=1 Tax=Ipomoea nil TaxID=35883 RepID=UPI000900BAC0|nr:PREDICTED: uncharacterized protein LOC109151114 [Ipomoea nil]XP_019154575.1 PREDICTED: uncharacterized protein LOC109151114 [Ipomoea nil]